MNFINDRNKQVQKNWDNKELRVAAENWHNISRTFNYAYIFEFGGLPIIQDPQDICMMQEVIWKIKPTIIIETGVAHGGSLILSAVMLSALNQAEVLKGELPKKRFVIGIDIELRSENMSNIRQHPLSGMINLIEGSSVNDGVVDAVTQLISPRDSVMVILDSNHEEDHVLKELMLYSDFVSVGSAVVVMDTGIEFAPPQTMNRVRPWGPGANPYTASKKFLKSEKGKNFEIDRQYEKRMLITCATEGLLFRVS